MSADFHDHDRLVHIALDQKTLARRSPEIEHERNVAIHDLLERNAFRPLKVPDPCQGPYKLLISLIDHRQLAFQVSTEADESVSTVILSLSPFRRLIKDYIDICSSYYDAIKVKTPQQIETIDMARRALHNEGAELLNLRLQDKILLNPPTARRLYTLVCVLHYRESFT